MKRFPWFELTIFSAFLADLALICIFQYQTGRDITPDAVLFSALADFIPVLLFMALPVVSVPLSMLILLIRGIDVGAYAALKEPLTYPVFRLLAEHTEHASLAAQFGTFYYIGAGLILLLTAALFFFWTRLKKTVPAERLWFYGILAAAVAGYMILLSPETERHCWGTLQNLIRSGAEDIKQKRQPVRYGYNLRHYDPETPYAEYLPNPHADVQYAAEWQNFERVIVIAAESLDLKFIHAYNPDQIPADATPFLDRTVQEYPSFTNYFTGSQPTSCAFNAMILSRFFFNRDLRMKNVSLTDELRKLGFKSMYIAPVNGKLFDNKKDYARTFRFDELYFMEDFCRKQETRWGLSDKTLFEEAAKILNRNKDKKHITFISTMDLHHPYLSSGGSFLEALKLTDRNLEHFIHSLELDSRTMVILTADHSATHGANYTGRPEFTPDRIPFIIITKEKLPELRLDCYWSQIDFPATLLVKLGAVRLPETFIGQPAGKEDFALTASGLDGRIYLHRPGRKTEVLPPETLELYYPR